MDLVFRVLFHLKQELRILKFQNQKSVKDTSIVKENFEGYFRRNAIHYSCEYYIEVVG